MTILNMIDHEAAKYADYNAETAEERQRMYEDFRNGEISVLREVFTLYLHGDMQFIVGKI